MSTTSPAQTFGPPTDLRASAPGLGDLLTRACLLDHAKVEVFSNCTCGGVLACKSLIVHRMAVLAASFHLGLLRWARGPTRARKVTDPTALAANRLVGVKAVRIRVLCAPKPF